LTRLGWGHAVGSPNLRAPTLRIFGPARCDGAGGTECPYVVRGRLERDAAGGGRIRVLEPAECAARWPTLPLPWMVPYDGLPHGGPRRLAPEEVRSLVSLLAVSGPRQ
jgi:hypothetical protein